MSQPLHGMLSMLKSSVRQLAEELRSFDRVGYRAGEPQCTHRAGLRLLVVEPDRVIAEFPQYDITMNGITDEATYCVRP